MDIIKEVADYSAKLEKRIRFLEQKGASLPNTHLKYKTQGGHVFFYETSSLEQKGKYIKKKNISEIQPLLNAHYIRKCLPILRQNQNAAKRFLQLHSHIEEATIIENSPKEIRTINSNLFPDKESLIEMWQNKPYKRNPYMEQNLVVETMRGEKVRSKSEAIIANILYAKHIPYKIECPLKLKQKTIYPDFTIFDPNALEEIYWEHFGRMGDAEYADNVCKKVNMYDENNIVLGDRLIATFESLYTPLSSNRVEKIIDRIAKRIE